ncbi:MAG: TIGR00730 family Rossman fold protein [Deltaproteobacteria bacterium]|nr:TIGR00730 family Rossman fold protein [Deltaproteobacteria bacterium]
MNRICIFAGSRVSDDPSHAEAARQLAAVLCEKGLGAVYGGGDVGMMGIFADAMLERGGELHGVIPGFMVAKELQHPRVSPMHVVESMAERKALMTELSVAFVALPGGVGTLDEVFEMLTARQLNLQPHPVGLLDVGGYFDPLDQQMKLAHRHGYVGDLDMDRFIVETDPSRLIDRLLAAR